jgi:hypothetical protein
MWKRWPSGSEELEVIRQQIESGFDDITEIDPEIRGIVERNWPHFAGQASARPMSRV